MSGLAEMFQAGGWWMYPLMLLGCALVPLSIVFVSLGVASKERNAVMFSLTLLVAGITPAMLGAVAQMMSMRAAEEAIVHVNPADAATIRAVALSESMTTVLFGLSLSVIPVFCGFVLLGVGLSRLPRFEEKT
ncbi:MAG: hypothetical protein AMXMBFR34_33580 [Myxococcaceae bacterium]